MVSKGGEIKKGSLLAMPTTVICVVLIQTVNLFSHHSKKALICSAIFVTQSSSTACNAFVPFYLLWGGWLAD